MSVIVSYSVHSNSLIAAQPTLPKTDATCFKCLSWQHSILIPNTISVIYFCLTKHLKIYSLKTKLLFAQGSAIWVGLSWAFLPVSLGVIHATADMWRLVWGWPKRRLYSHFWCLSQSGQNHWGTAGNVHSPCNLSSRVAGPFHMVAQGSARVKAEASRPRAYAQNWSSTTSVQANASICSKSRAGEMSSTC